MVLAEETRFELVCPEGLCVSNAARLPAPPLFHKAVSAPAPSATEFRSACSSTTDLGAGLAGPCLHPTDAYSDMLVAGRRIELRKSGL